MKSKPASAGRSRLATSVLTLGLVSAVHAAPDAVDSILVDASNYSAGNLVGQGPATLGFTGNWLEAYGGAQSPTVIASGLAYSDGTNDLETFGGAVEYPAGGFGRAGRVLSSPYTNATDGAVYFSFLIQLDAVVTDAYRGVEFHSGGFDDGANRKIQIVTGEGTANPSGNDRFTIRLFNNNGGGFAGDLGAGNTNVNLVVGKITFSSTGSSDAIDVWLNPSDLTDEVASGAPAFTKSGFDLEIDRVSLARFNGTNGFVADEFRLGATWTDVLPVVGLNPDTDSDGLLNSVETDNGPGSFVDANDTGTDPNDPDTDDDYLGDKFEVDNNGSLGTDPTLADSDADGVNDATEISLTGTANDPSTPSGGDTEIIGFDFFDYADGGIDGATGFETRVFDFDNNTNNDSFLGHTGSVAPWSTSFGSQVLCGRLLTENSNAIRQFNGPDTGGSDLGRVENIVTIDAKVVYAKIDLTRLNGATFSGLSFVNGSTEVAFAGVRDALNGPDRNFGVEVTGEAGSGFTGDIPVDRQPNTFVARLDTTGTPSIAIWVDPDISTGSAPAPDATADFVTASSAVATGLRLSSGGRALWDNLVVSTTWDDLDDVNPTDADAGGPDGLRDSWEEIFAPGDLTILDSGVSNDADSLLNEEEQSAGTNPLDPDTDGDNLNDDVETNTGVFVSSTDTGTDPCDQDTDDDTLNDNEEDGSGTFVPGTQPGSNPNLADTDSDGENDGFEFFQGTDPNNGSDNSATNGLVQVNGQIDGGDGYGTALAVQTVETQFGDNASELNAAYARIQDGNLYLMITGNIEDNFNKLSVFIDSTDDITANDYISAGNDGTGAMDGMLFDTTFTPEYHLVLRRGTDNGNDKFDVDFANLVTPAFSQYFDILTFGTTGYGATGTGVNTSPIRVGYNNDNTAGVLGGIAAADQVAAAAVTTGVEICIDLADLGSPSGSFKVMAFVTNGDHTFMSNQVLGGLPVDLDDPGPGTSNLGDPSVVEFDLITGDQFFVVNPPTAEPFAIDSVTLVNSGTQLEIVVKGLVNGQDYVLRESSDLGSFGAVTTTVAPSASFTASGTTQTLTVDLPVGARRFYRVEDAP